MKNITWHSSQPYKMTASKQKYLEDMYELDMYWGHRDFRSRDYLWVNGGQENSDFMYIPRWWTI